MPVACHLALARQETLNPRHLQHLQLAEHAAVAGGLAGMGVEAALGKPEHGRAGATAYSHHIFTDEVLSPKGATSRFSETTPYDPRSPYSAQGDGVAQH